MTSTNRHLILFGAALSFIVIALQIFSPSLINLLSFWSEKISQGELWRLLTAHFIHFNFIHCCINLAGLWLLIFIFYWKLPTKTLAFVLIFCLLGVDAGLFLQSTANQEYIGLSGALHGFAVAGACYNKDYKLWRRMAFILIIFLKVIYENFLMPYSNGIANQYTFIVAVDAHAYGAISGLVIGVLPKFLHQGFQNRLMT